MPPQMRLCASSSPSFHRLEYGSDHATEPSARYQTALNCCESPPSTFASMRALPVPRQVMLLAYAGYGGVVTSGAQPASASVSGLSSLAALMMAVSGRHSRKTSLLFCDVRRLSCIDTIVRANRRAVPTSDNPR